MTTNAAWTTSHFPASMRSLNYSTRARAIEIANQLLEQGQLSPQRIISVSIDEARRWARCSRTEPDTVTTQMRPFG